jgi:transcription initiation factor TFIID subunit 11
MSSTTGGKRSRGRPKKRKNQPYDIQTGRGGGDDDDGTSTVLDGVDNTHNHSRSRGGGVGTKSVISGTGPNAADEAADDEDDAPLADPNSDESRRLQAEIAKEKEHIATLQEALTTEQMQRYISYTRTKLKMGTLKRIINQTVSQSVTPNPLQAVQWVGKVFVGEIVEMARAVQGEWAVGWQRAKEEERKEREKRNEQTKEEVDGEGVVRPKSTTTAPTVNPTEDLYAGANPHRGGLLPDHIREALRRYKADGDGGGVGFGGYSFGNLAVKGEAVPRLGMGSGAVGRRLFR